MKVTVELFGVLRQLAGTAETIVETAAEPVTARDVLESLASRLPALSAHFDRTACAVGTAIIDRDTIIRAGESLVLIPPVSGG